MGRYFDFFYDGPPFELFGTGHLIFLGFFFITVLWIIFGWKNPSEQAKMRIRYILAGILLVGEVSWHLWSLYWDAWYLTFHLPLHLCSILVWASIVLLLTKNYRIYEFSYFLGIGTAIQPVFTPGPGIYGLPHYRVLQILIVHSVLVLAPIYLTVHEGLRPTWRSILRVILVTDLYMVMVHFVNLALGSNYLYTMHPPPSASLIDFLGPWPWYLLSFQVVGGAIFVLLYLPFAIKDAKAKRLAAAS